MQIISSNKVILRSINNSGPRIPVGSGLDNKSSMSLYAVFKRHDILALTSSGSRISHTDKTLCFYTCLSVHGGGEGDSTWAGTPP